MGSSRATESHRKHTRHLLHLPEHRRHPGRMYGLLSGTVQSRAAGTSGQGHKHLSCRVPAFAKSSRAPAPGVHTDKWTDVQETWGAESSQAPRVDRLSYSLASYLMCPKSQGHGPSVAVTAAVSWSPQLKCFPLL